MRDGMRRPIGELAARVSERESAVVADAVRRHLPRELVEAAEGVGGYAASIAPLGGGLAAITVAEGTSPDFRLRSRVVDLGGG